MVEMISPRRGSRFYLLLPRLRRRVRADEADEHRREAGDEEAEGDRQQHPLEPLPRAELVPGHDAPEAVPQTAAAAAACPVAAAVIRVADRRRLVDGPAVRHVLARDVRNLSVWRARPGGSRSLATREMGGPLVDRVVFFFSDGHAFCGFPFPFSFSVSLSLSCSWQRAMWLHPRVCTIRAIPATSKECVVCRIYTRAH